MKWEYSEAQAIWNAAEKNEGGVGLERAYMKACEYAGLYHVIEKTELRDEYTRLARTIGKELFPKAGLYYDAGEALERIEKKSTRGRVGSDALGGRTLTSRTIRKSIGGTKAATGRMC